MRSINLIRESNPASLCFLLSLGNVLLEKEKRSLKPPKAEKLDPMKMGLGMTVSGARVVVEDWQNKISVGLVENGGDFNSIQINKWRSILVNSKAARIVAFHKVITNKGVRSPGVDKERPTTNKQYLDYIERLRENVKNPSFYVPKPLDRIYLVKPNGKLRPISIPTIFDRCMQAIHLLALEPLAEHQADEGSYGFRRGRSTAWAAHHVKLGLAGRMSPKWVLELDIEGCFNNISFEWMLSNIPLDPKLLNSWLKQGFIERKDPTTNKPGTFQETTAGIPQGGIISPTICNMVLDGMTEYVRTYIWNQIKEGKVSAKKLGYSRLRKPGSSQESKLFILVRYADDVVVLSKTKLIASWALKAIELFLEPRGLNVSKDKTLLTDISGGRAQFQFLGFLFKKVPFKRRSQWLISATDESFKRVKAKVREILHTKKYTIPYIFSKTNEVITGWCNYYRSANFRHQANIFTWWLGNAFYSALFRRLRKTTHVRRGRRISLKLIYHRIARSYLGDLTRSGGRKYKWFILNRSKGNDRRKKFFLFNPRAMELISPGKAQLFEAGLSYTLRSEREAIKKVCLNHSYGLRQTIRSRDKYTCQRCKVDLLCADIPYDIHHIRAVSLGGDNTPSNLMLLCHECHSEISTAVSRVNFKAMWAFHKQGFLNIFPKDILRFAK